MNAPAFKTTYRASELVALLQKLIAEHGDLPVVTKDPDTGWRMEIGAPQGSLRCDGVVRIFLPMTFIPQALADPVSRSVLFVWHDEENFRRYWADKVKTIDAPGVPTHPRLIKVGDVIDWFVTGWNRATVKAVKFTPDASDIPDYHRSGCYTFETDGEFLSIRVDGRKVIDAPMHVFPANDPGQTAATNAAK